MTSDASLDAFFKDPKIIEFKKTFHPPPPVVRYKEHLRIHEKTKNCFKNDILIIKKIVRVITGTMRKFMCFSVCQDSSVDERREMYKKALQECRVNKLPARFKDYRKEKSQKIFIIVALADSAGITAGAAGGAIVGGIIGGPIGAALGAAGGGLAGVVGGSVVSSLMVSNHFKQWKKKVDSDQFIQKLVEFHKDHEELRDFICIFSGELIVDPVTSHYGQTYERAWITEWINERERILESEDDPDWSTTDPKRNGRLKVNDLRTDYGAIARMQAVYSKILTDDIGNNEIPQYIKEGLIAIRKDIDKQIKHGLQIVEKQYFHDLLKKRITKEEFTDLEAERTKIKIELMDFIEL